MDRDRQLAIGFIGIGVLGKGLAMALAARQYRVVAAHSRSLSSAQWLADRVPGCRVCTTPQELANAADLVFITTPDSVIPEVAAQVSWRLGQAVVHCCGAASLEMLQSAADQGAVIGALHPFQTFAVLDTPQEAISRLSGVTFAVSGRDWLRDFLFSLVRDLDGRPVCIRDEDRPLYHAAAVIGCGYLVALMQAAIDLWQEMGFSHQEAIDALYPLARVTIENVAKGGIGNSVTGPVVRGDATTIQSHLETLLHRLPQLVPLYRALTGASLSLAAARAVTPPQMEAIRRVIDRYGRS